jgi:hypothetical protein
MLDDNRDGVLTRTEVFGTEPPPDLFTSVDVNRNGTIARDEWHWSLASFDHLDKNRDGRLTREEFSGTVPGATRSQAYQAGHDSGLIEAVQRAVRIASGIRDGTLKGSANWSRRIRGTTRGWARAPTTRRGIARPFGSAIERVSGPVSVQRDFFLAVSGVPGDHRAVFRWLLGIIAFLVAAGIQTRVDWAAERTNVPRAVCEAALAHTLRDKTEAAYHRTDLFDRRRELMDTWAKFATAKPADVVSIRA